MLSLEACKKQSGSAAPKTQEELILLREQMYALAYTTIGLFTDPIAMSCMETTPASQTTSNAKIDTLSTSHPDWYELEERAAIMEYDGGLRREEAVILSLEGYLKRKMTKGFQDS